MKKVEEANAEKLNQKPSKWKMVRALRKVVSQTPSSAPPEIGVVNGNETKPSSSEKGKINGDDVKTSKL